MSYTPSYPAELRLKAAETEEYAYMTFVDGKFDISTHTGMSGDGPYNDYASMTINGRTLDIAVNLEPYEKLIQVTNGNYTGVGNAPLDISSSALGINVALTANSTSALNGNVTVGNNASLTLDSGSNATFNGSLSIVGAGDLSVDSGNVTLATGDVNVDAGDVNVTAGDVNVTAGAVTVSAGHVNVTLGDVNVTAGDVIVADEDDEAGLKNIVAWLRNTFGLAKGIFASPE
uniref:Uncharacterized protein n=1 Tax=viral metagenome TaxID=1070528 RepID=A0A6C0DZ73_9ZZZZ